MLRSFFITISSLVLKNYKMKSKQLKKILKTRITADIDSKDLSIPLLKILIMLERVNVSKIIIKESNSKGFHLIIFTYDKLSSYQLMKLRKFLGDDIKRINRDKKRKNPKQYLFYKKIPLINIDRKV